MYEAGGGVCMRVVCNGLLFLVKKAVFRKDWLPLAECPDL